MSYELQPDDPLLAPAGQPIEGETLRQLVLRQCPPFASERKRRAWVAYDVYRGRLENLILLAVHRQQNSETIRKEMARFLTSVRNDARDVTEQVAVVWKNGAKRHIGSDEGSSDDERSAQEKALRELAEEASFDVVAEQVNHLAWLQGPQFVVPVVRDGLLRADVVGPHIYDIVQNVADPLGHPVGLAWHLSKHVDGDIIERHVHVLDAFTLRRIMVRGNVLTEVDRTEHNYGRLPAACLRFSNPIAGDDWFLVDEQHRLTSGTVEVGVKLARMALVRKTQCHKLLTLVGDLSTVPRGQEGIADPEQPVLADTGIKPGGRGVEINTLDFNTPPDDAIKEILFWVLSMLEPLGGHIQVDPGQPDIYGKIQLPPAAQAEHRKRQIKPASRFEAEFWGAATAMVKAEQHEQAIELPDPADVRRLLRVNFGALARDLEDPDKATAYEDWLLSRGQASEVGLMQRSMGGVSEEEAKAEIERNMKNREWFNNLARVSNLSTNLDGQTMTAPEANGAQGTPAREANRAVMAAQGDAAGGGGRPAPEPT
jgi:hypothetical protein